MLLTNQWFTEEIKEEIKNFFLEKISLVETKENKITLIQNLWDTAKAFLRGKFIVTQAYLRKKKKNNLALHLKELEKEEQKNLSKRLEQKLIEAKKTTEKINKTKTQFFEKISKIDKDS